MQLTPHFTLAEFTRSATASARGIDNSLSPSNPEHARIIANLMNLCQQVLEPLRAYANSISPHTQGEPEGVYINSGYRCPALNKAVGGAPNSNHLYGYAADIRLPSVETGRKWFRWLMDNCPYDELIWESRTTPPLKQGELERVCYWIHVSYRDVSKHSIK